MDYFFKQFNLFSPEAMKPKFIYLIILISIMACKNQTKKVNQDVVQYPQTKQVDTIDTYFGTAVKDPYRWLEDDRSEETENWVKLQNEVTYAYLSNIPYRDDLKKRLETL